MSFFPVTLVFFIFLFVFPFSLFKNNLVMYQNASYLSGFVWGFVFPFLSLFCVLELCFCVLLLWKPFF